MDGRKGRGRGESRDGGWKKRRGEGGDEGSGEAVIQEQVLKTL
jgi:hypothetical protein